MDINYEKALKHIICGHCENVIPPGTYLIIIRGRKEKLTIHAEPCFLEAVEKLEYQAAKARLMEGGSEK